MNKKAKREAIKLGVRAAQALVAGGVVTPEQAASAKIVFQGHKNKVRLKADNRRTPPGKEK